MIVVSACSSQKTPVEDQKAAGKEQASSAVQPQSTPAANKTEAKINIVPPSGWKPVEGSVLQVQYMKNTASFMVKSEPFTQKNIDDVAAEAQKIFTNTFSKVNFAGKAEAITVDGKDARKIVFTCEVSGMQMKYEYVYVFVGKEVYAITFGDLAASFDSLSADYEQILKDISFNQ
jgi:hypothetical protein